MAKRFLIGIGGTGSKCVESVAHLSACGLGPEDMYVGLVEMDRQNGNLARTVETLGEYHRLRESLVGSDNNMGKCGLFGTELILPPGELFWCPLSDPTQSFDLYCGRHRFEPVPRMFFDALFTRDESREALDAGFRGRPAMGAPVFLNLDVADIFKKEEDTLWSLLFDKGRLQGEDVHIFLAGSIFGGTGASGIPNLAKIIRKKFSEKSTSGKLTIGVCLMLPYFTFRTKSFQEDEVIARPETFHANAKATLHYYNNLQSENIFDTIFLMGWSPLIELANVSAGRGSQKNPSLLPELLAAQACLRFFHDPASVKGTILTRRNTSETFTWSDLPSIRTGKNNELMLAMGKMIRFAYAYMRIYGPFLCSQDDSISELTSRLKQAASQPWFHRLFSQKNVDIFNEQQTFETMTGYCSRYLAWINSLVRSVKGTELFRVSGFEGSPPWDAESSGLGLASLKCGNEFDLPGFPSLVIDRQGSSLSNIFRQLNLYKNSDSLKGTGAFFRALHDVCAL